MHDYVAELCRRQDEVKQNQENDHVCSTGQGEARERKYNGFKLSGGQAYDCSSD
jgi:hypothetical protein